MRSIYLSYMKYLSLLLALSVQTCAVAQNVVSSYNDGLTPGLYKVFPVSGTGKNFDAGKWMIVLPGIEKDQRVFTFADDQHARDLQATNGVGPLPEIGPLPTTLPYSPAPATATKPSILQGFRRGLYNFGTTLQQGGPALQPSSQVPMTTGSSHTYFLPDGRVINSFSTQHSTTYSGL